MNKEQMELNHRPTESLQADETREYTYYVLIKNKIVSPELYSGFGHARINAAPSYTRA